VCKSAKSKAKPYKITDGNGLYLLITPNGSKLWRFKYRFLKKEKSLSIGSYDLVSLAEAREARDRARKLLTQDPPVDPAEQKKENKRTAIRNAENTFKTVALEWIDLNKERWSDGYTKKIEKILKKNVYPSLGRRPISKISTSELLNDCLKKIGSLEIAGRSRQLCSQVFYYGIQTDRCQLNPAANLHGALKPYKTQHFRTISMQDLPKFLKALERNEARIFECTRRALWLSLYTFCRPVEIRTNRWIHNHFEKKLWIIPGEFMKMRRDHIVPLSKQALEILRLQQQELDGLNTEWVFPNQFNLSKSMSDGTVNKAIQRLGFGDDMVAHGVRALARTVIREELGYDSEVIEKQLAHKPKNPLGEAYDRTQFLSERKKMMQEWADYLDSIRKKTAYLL
jgi:integrase